MSGSTISTPLEPSLFVSPLKKSGTVPFFWPGFLGGNPTHSTVEFAYHMHELMTDNTNFQFASWNSWRGEWNPHTLPPTTQSSNPLHYVGGALGPADPERVLRVETCWAHTIEPATVMYGAGCPGRDFWWVSKTPLGCRNKKMSSLPFSQYGFSARSLVHCLKSVKGVECIW